MKTALAACISRRHISYVDALWFTFVAVQALDGVLTYVGVRAFGMGIEANPIVAWYATTFGPAAGLAAAKLFAVGCASVLYVTARHGTVALLTLLYLVFAIAPWAHVLNTYSR
jgi:hypothetical protein